MSGQQEAATLPRETRHLNGDQLRALAVLTTAVAPLHNLYRANENRHDHGIERCGPNGIKVKLKHRHLGTYDQDFLTRLVIEAHRRRCRVDICPTSGFGLIEVTVHARQPEGNRYERHPGLDDLKEQMDRWAPEPNGTTGGES